MAEPQRHDKPLAKDVFVVEEYEGKNYWHQVGVAFVNKDGSLSLKLFMFPELWLQIRDRKPADIN